MKIPTAQADAGAWPKHLKPPKPPKRQGHRALRFAGRFLAFLLVMVLSLASLAYGASYILCRGPSPAARDLFVISCEETSAAKFVPRLFLSEEEIQGIFARNSVLETQEITDTQTEFVPPAQDVALEDIQLVEVVGSTFKGKMLIVQDPSRVKLAVLPAFSTETDGKRIEDFVAEAGAVAGINAGGFEDENGVGKGGKPLGLIIQNSVLRHGSLDARYSVVGFDANHKLVVGQMTGRDAVNLGVRDAVSFGPAFIVNGKAAEVVGTGGGLNPRTVLGQRADGAVLLLVIDGRQPHSLGASYKDCIDVMLEFEAVNAANLDGGSSSVMIYEGEMVNVCASLYGSRQQPGAFIIL